MKLNIDELTMLINADDQNIFSKSTNCSSNSSGVGEMLAEEAPLNNENSDQSIDHMASFGDEPCTLINEGDFHQPNKRQFFTAKSLTISIVNDCKTLEFERRALNTDCALNRLTSVSLEFLKFNFIFDYDFAKLIDHILNLKKCLFKIHFEKAVNGASELAPLSTDLLINVKKLTLVIEDDPFEIKLAYNYALMLDEHLESLKRRKQLEQRRLIKEQHLEKEALEILNERESLIYLQRSKSIYNRITDVERRAQMQQREIRRELFCLSSENLSFYALCDAKWHGKHKCYERLRQMDKASAPPPPPATQSNLCESAESSPANGYHLLWCRYISLNTDEFKFVFRDYTQPLLKTQQLAMFGYFIGAEYEPHPRTKRDVTIGLGISEENTDGATSFVFNIQRSMSPFKFYHDICSKMTFLSCAYGPCWEGRQIIISNIYSISKKLSF